MAAPLNQLQGFMSPLLEGVIRGPWHVVHGKSII